MLCLLTETTSPKGSLALYSFENKTIRPLSIKRWEGPSHSNFITSTFESLIPSLQNQLNLSHLKNLPSLLSLQTTSSSPPLFISLGVGPGRFTGVRVGVSFAKTVSFALNIPIYPVSSLKILAESQAEQEKPVLVLLNAFKNSLYMALYQKKEGKIKELISPSLVLPQDLHEYIKEETLCIGDGYRAYENIFPAELKEKLKLKDYIFPEVKHLASLLQREFNPSQLINWKELKPVYLRSPVKLLKEGLSSKESHL